MTSNVVVKLWPNDILHIAFYSSYGLPLGIR